MNNLKTINLIGNICLFLNLVVGLLQLHWTVIIVFAIIHTIVRMMYLKAEQNQTIDPNAQSSDIQKTVVAPPAIRNFASVISGVVMAGIIYAVGYGLRYGFNMVAG